MHMSVKYLPHPKRFASELAIHGQQYVLEKSSVLMFQLTESLMSWPNSLQFKVLGAVMCS